MKYAIGVPNVGEFADAGFLAETAVEAEAAGWDGFFLWDHLLYRHGWPAADPWTALAAAAILTSRIRLGVVAAVLARYQPEMIAQQCTGIDRLASGRFILGAGLGSMEAEFACFGRPADPRERAGRLDEALELVDAYWRGGAVHRQSRYFTVDAPTVGVRPVQTPRPPVWIAGRWPNRQPFVRAAGWDGAVPTHTDFGKGETMPASTLAEIVGFTRSHVPDGHRFDVAIEGSTPGRDVRAYAAAGATWWIEALGWWRGTRKDNLARVRAGFAP